MIRSKGPLLLTFSALAACRPVQPAPPEPPRVVASQSAPKAPTETRPTSSATTVVALVGDVEITRRDLERATKGYAPHLSPSEVLRIVVERVLVRRAAEEGGFDVTRSEADLAIADFAKRGWVTPAALRANVEASQLSWEDYREQCVTQMYEGQLVHPRPIARTAKKEDEREAWLAAWNHERRVVIACLRADTPIEVYDPELELPDEPYTTPVTIEDVRILGDAGPSSAPWVAAARSAIVPDTPLCRSLPAIEDAVTSAMQDAGHLLATVEARWPDAGMSASTVELDVAIGPLHRIGKVSVDQSLVPKAWRIDEAALRDRVDVRLVRGDVASHSRLDGARAALGTAVAAYGLGVTGAARTVHDVGDEVRVDVRYQLAPAKRSRGSAFGDPPG